VVILRRVWPVIVLAAFFGALRTLSFGAAPRANVNCDAVDARDTAHLEQCAAARPADEGLLVDLGAAYEQRGDGARAESAFRRALSVDPEDGDVHRRLARLLSARGDGNGARREAAAAASLQPGAPDAAPGSPPTEQAR
jgi:Flp pilus assembly protein TadD